LGDQPRHIELAARRRDTWNSGDARPEHGIAPDIELIAAEHINDAYERVVKSDVRYHFVIDVDTLA
jgi:uncharacterized zinc-type alcohol dehydrogenase-like protein